jgi:hypothetical protein
VGLINVRLPKRDSRVYVFLWVLAIPIGWILWFMFLDHIIDVWSYFLPLTFGLAVGMFSGLSPVRAFQACFLGFLVLTITIGIAFSVAIYMIIFGSFAGLIALGGAIFRKVILHEGVDLNLEWWQWALLLSGVIVFTDIILVGVFREPSPYLLDHFLKNMLVPVLLGVFATSYVTGSYSRQKEWTLLTSAAITVFVIDFLFFLYLLDSSSRIEERGMILHGALLFMGLFLIAVLTGILVGCKCRRYLIQPQKRCNL